MKLRNAPQDFNGDQSWFYENKTGIDIYTWRPKLINNGVGELSYRRLANVLKRAGWNVSKSK